MKPVTYKKHGCHTRRIATTPSLSRQEAQSCAVLRSSTTPYQGPSFKVSWRKVDPEVTRRRTGLRTRSVKPARHPPTGLSGWPCPLARYTCPLHHNRYQSSDAWMNEFRIYLPFTLTSLPTSCCLDGRGPQNHRAWHLAFLSPAPGDADR